MFRNLKNAHACIFSMPAGRLDGPGRHVPKPIANVSLSHMHPSLADPPHLGSKTRQMTCLVQLTWSIRKRVPGESWGIHPDHSVLSRTGKLVRMNASTAHVKSTSCSPVATLSRQSKSRTGIHSRLVLRIRVPLGKGWSHVGGSSIRLDRCCGSTRTVSNLLYFSLAI